MVTEFPSAGETLKIFYCDEWHELIVRTRFAPILEKAHADTLSMLTVKTISTWMHAWKAIKHQTWEVEAQSAEMITSNEYKQDFRTKSEPFVTVFNKRYDALSITVHSNENGQGAVNAALALSHARGFIAEKMPTLFEAPTEPQKQAKAPEKRDLDNVDSFLHDAPPQTPQTGMTQVKAFVRPAMQGTIPNTLKLQKGAKGKETFEMAIVPTTPYSANAVEFQEKDLIVYPIMGAIRYEGGTSGYYFAIPVPNSEIHIKVKEATQWNGQSIESDSQKLAQHLSITGELTQGMKWNVPATHIAMKVGKTGDKGQFKNYVGLYELK